MFLFFALTFGAYADTTIELLIDGKKHATVTVEEIKKMKSSDVEYYHRLIKRAEPYKGVPTTYLLEKAYPGFATKYSEVEFHGLDEYKSYVPVSQLLRYNSILSYQRADGDAFVRISTRTKTLTPLAPLYLVWDMRLVPKAERDALSSAYQIHVINMISKSVKTTETDNKIVKGYGYYKQYCINCHSVGSRGGKIGPNLIERNVIETRGAEYFKKYVLNPQSMNPKSTMLAFNVTNKEDIVDHVIEFLKFAKAPEAALTSETPKGKAYGTLKEISAELELK